MDADAVPAPSEDRDDRPEDAPRRDPFPGAVHVVDLDTGASTVFSSDPRFVDPQRILADGRGGFLIIDYDADPDGRGGDTAAIFRLTSRGEVIAVYSPQELVAPTAALLRDDGVLLVTDRRARPSAGSIGDSQGALFALDLDRGTCTVLTVHPAFRAPADLIRAADHEVLLLDADTIGAEKGSEGAVFRIDDRTGEVQEVRRLRGAISPLGMLLLDDGDLLIFDVNADPLKIGGPLGAVFRLEAGSDAMTVVTSAPKYFRDPVRGRELEDGTILIVDANADPAGRGPDPVGRGQNLTGGGALLRLDLATKAITVLAAPESFVNPVDVLELR